MAGAWHAWPGVCMPAGCSAEGRGGSYASISDYGEAFHLWHAGNKILTERLQDSIFRTAAQAFGGMLYLTTRCCRLRIAMPSYPLDIAKHGHDDAFVWLQDLPNALDDAQIAEALGLHSIKSRDWAIFKTSAVKGEGLFEGLDWLSNMLKNRPRR